MTPEQIDQVLQAAKSFEISRGYFSDILNSQIVIFSLIVGALLALQWLFQWRVSEATIERNVKTEVDKIAKKLKGEIEAEKIKNTEEIEAKFAKLTETSDYLRGEIYRALAQHCEKDKYFSGAFIWWLRAGDYFHRANEHNLTQIALKGAQTNLNNVSYEYEIALDVRKEFQEICANLPEDKFHIEKEMLMTKFKEILNKVFKAGSSV